MNNPLLSTANSTNLLKPSIPYRISPNTAINKKQKQQSKTLVVKSNVRSTTTTLTNTTVSVARRRRNKNGVFEETTTFKQVDRIDQGKAVLLCALGYWVQGSRCFPWLALNFHMAHCLNLKPSTLQLVQYSASLPMVAKPLYGVLSDVLYIGRARRVPYISIGG